MPVRSERSFPNDNQFAVFAALAIALAPAVLLAALNPRFSAAPFTAVMVFFGPTITHTGPIAAAFERVIEVAVGCVVGLLVSLVVLPARAHDLAVKAATEMLELMARSLPELFIGFTQRLDRPTLTSIQNRIGEAFAQLDKAALEAQHERMTRLRAEPDQAPLLRTLLRLRHDLIMIGRAAVAPLPGVFEARLGPWLARMSDTVADYLHASAAALSTRQGPPPLDHVEATLDGYAAEIAALRRQGLTRELPDDAVERIFAIGFALDQLHLHLRDLARCLAEFAPARSAAVAQAAASAGPARP